MNKLKKLSLLIILLIFIGSIFSIKAYATFTCKVNLSSQSNSYSTNDEFTVNVNITDIQTSQGIIAISAILEYDKNILTLVEIDGQNKWSAPYYNEANGKFTTLKNNFATNDESVLVVKFKPKAQGNSTIKIKDFTISDGNEEANVGNASISISIKETTPQKPDNNQGNQNNNSSTQKPNNSNNTNNTKPTTPNSNGSTTNLPNSSSQNSNLNQGSIPNNTTNIESENNFTNEEENFVNTVIDENITNEISTPQQNRNEINNIIENDENMKKYDTTKQMQRIFLIYIPIVVAIVTIIIALFDIIKHSKK